METTTTSQGQWHTQPTAGEHGQAIVYDDSGKTIAVVYDDQFAKLITAAPDLLAELKQAELTLRWAAQEAKGKVHREIVGGWIHHANNACAAIEKATQ